MTLFILTQSPYSDTQAIEALEAILVSGAFDQSPKLLFRNSGVLQLVPEQNTKNIGLRSISKGLRSLEHYEVTEFYACANSLDRYKLNKDQLVLPIHTLNAKQIRDLIVLQSIVATF